MADLTITAANVSVESTKLVPLPVTFGETVTNGQGVYKDSSNNKWYKADANVTDKEAGQRGLGIVLMGNVTDGAGVIADGCGTIDVGATLTVGTTYIVSETAGGIAPAGDWTGFTTGSRLSIFGVATATDRLLLLQNALLAVK